EKKEIYFTNAIRIKVLLISLTAALIIFVAPRFSNIEGAVVLIPFVALLVIFDNLRDFIFAYFRGIEKMEREAFLIVIMNTAIALFGFIVLQFNKTAGALLFSYIASVVILSIVAFYFIKDAIKGIFKNFDKEIFKQFYRNSWPFAFIGLFGIFMLNIDIIMLGWLRSAEEIGYYSASQRVVQILYTLPAIIASAIFPAVARFIKQKDFDKAKILNEKSITMLYFIAMPLAIGGIVLSSAIIAFLFGKEYLPASVSFQILIASVLIQFPSAILSNLTIAHNQQKKLIGYAAFGSISNVLFNALLIPIWGIAGSAIATLTAQLAFYVPIWLKMKRINNFYTFRHLKKIIASAAIMGISAFFINKLGVNVLLNIIISAGVYLIAIYLLKEKILKDIISLSQKVKTP
ncbi:hypothetical protein COY96_01695, partial [Candidatus Wolfebacteria bacterium CG_4_10_14_0_8_um_filter_37_11]